MKMFDWFRRKSLQIRGDRIEDSYHAGKTGLITLEDQRNGRNGSASAWRSESNSPRSSRRMSPKDVNNDVAQVQSEASNGEGREQFYLTEKLGDLPSGLLAIGTFGLFHHIPDSNAEHHFPDLVDDMDDAEAVSDAYPNSKGTPNESNVNANVNIPSPHNVVETTCIMATASVKPKSPLEDVFSMSNKNKPTATRYAAKKSGTQIDFMKKVVEEKSSCRSGQGVVSGRNLDKVMRGGLFQRKIHPVDVELDAFASESESVDAGRAQVKGSKSKTWRTKLSCFTGCIFPENTDDGHMGAELKPPNTNLGRKPSTAERWIKTDGEYVVLEF